MARPPRLFLFLALLLFVRPVAAAAQPAAKSGAAPQLQSPASFLGYALGERFTPPHRAAAYVRHVAAASARAELKRYGTTHEGRPLQLVTLSAPENLSRLDALRRTHLRVTGLASTGAREREGEFTETPSTSNLQPSTRKAIVWLSYNVHGDEAVGTEAALKTLHALADPKNERTGRWLEQSVVLLDPLLNPDGRARYVQWYRQTRGARPNARPEAREHSPPWPGGRTNHYLFDLNRDWTWATQKETRARLEQYHRWMPHVHADFHEMGADAPYYFAPGAEPRHEALTPFQQDFQETMGRANAAVFDREGWLYFTGEVYDLFYPGYGDTWPLFNGAVGMTYEQGGGGRAGLLIQTAPGDSLSLKERIAHHHATALQTVETAAEERDRLTDAFADYYRAAQSGDPPGGAGAYVVSGQNTDRLRALTRLLDRQRIRYRYAAERGEARGTSYATDETERFQIETGDLVVPAAQPKARLARVLFERQPALSDSLTYDITAWALPFAFGMEAHITPERPDVRVRPAAAPPAPGEATEGAAPGSERAAPYAYLAEWKSLADARLLGRLLEKNVRVRFAREPFEAAGQRWGRGTLVIARTDNERPGEGFAETVAQAAQDQPLTPLESGLTSGGPDFGSASVARLEKPQVAVLAGAGLSSYAVGAVWHFFDQRLKYPATLLRAEDFAPDVLKGFDVLVMPSGDYGEILPKKKRAPLRRWVERGGRLVAMGRGTRFLAGADGFALERRQAPNAAGDTVARGEAPRRYAQRERRAASGRVPGTVFRARLDPTHPLAYGYAGSGAAGYYTLKRGVSALAPLPEGDGWNVATLPASGGERARPVSGFAGTEAQRRLAGSLVFGVEEVGEGRAVYLADDPLFRGFWQGGMLLFSNAVFLVGQ
jgi:hypothetical protein